MSYCPTCGVVSPPESHWQGCQTAPKVTDAADFDDGYRQGRRDTRAELVPVIDRQRAEILRLREALRPFARVYEGDSRASAELDYILVSDLERAAEALS